MIKNKDKNEIKFAAAFTDVEMEELFDLYSAILTMENPEELHKGQGKGQEFNQGQLNYDIKS